VRMGRAQKHRIDLSGKHPVVLKMPLPLDKAHVFKPFYGLHNAKLHHRKSSIGDSTMGRRRLNRVDQVKTAVKLHDTCDAPSPPRCWV
jgi:hypothetical protein